MQCWWFALGAFPVDRLAADLEEDLHGAFPGGVFAAPGSLRAKLSELSPEFEAVTGTGRDEEWGDDFLPAGMSAASVTGWMAGRSAVRGWYALPMAGGWW